MEKKTLRFSSFEMLFEFVTIADIHLFDLKGNDLLNAELTDAQLELAVNGYVALVVDDAIVTKEKACYRLNE